MPRWFVLHELGVDPAALDPALETARNVAAVRVEIYDGGERATRGEVRAFLRAAKTSTYITTTTDSPDDSGKVLLAG